MKTGAFKPRKKSMRQAYADKCRERGQMNPQWKTKAAAKPQTPRQPRSTLRAESKKRASEKRLYFKESAIWLNEPAHRACGICLVLGETPKASTEVHHYRGRRGRLLRDQRFWIPSCRSHRSTPHDRPNWAREVGILSSA